MRATSRAALAALVLLTGAGCASHRAPNGFLAEAKDIGRDPYGAWIDLTFVPRANETESVRGELLAATADSLWILGAEGGRTVATATVLDGELVRYDSRPGDITAATLGGTVSTLSNGVFLVFTAPMWLIGGPLAARSQARMPVRDLPVYRWEGLAAYARFPQGMPAGVSWADLKPKPNAEPKANAP